MTPEQWARLKTVFQSALDQPAASRRQWIAAACAGDTELAREVEALLEAHDTAGDFLERPAVLDSSADASDIDSDDAAANAEPFDTATLDAGRLVPGTSVGPYDILDEAGRGGMGVVYVATDRRLNRRVALKSLPEIRAGDQILRERLRREARAAATISHPGVATIYALDEIDGRLFLVSEYVPGTTLRHEIAQGPIEPARAISIAIEMAAALGAAHDAGVVHRDFKPENVLFTAEGRVKVVDFGIADVQEASLTRLTRDGALLGTPAYMAPEQLVGAAVDARADLYAFGVVLEEMLTGYHPMSAAARRSGPALNTAFTRIVDRCVRVDPAERYSSARALLVDLDALPRNLAGEGPGTGAAAQRGEPTPAGRWWWEFHQGITALVYAATVIAAWWGRGLIGGAFGRTFFVVALGSVIVAVTLRLHLWFTSRFYAAQLRWVRRRVARWILAADWIFSLALVSAGLLIGEDRSPIAVVLIVVGVAAAVSFLVIEPATTRAAFKSQAPPSSGTHRGA